MPPISNSFTGQSGYLAPAFKAAAVVVTITLALLWTVTAIQRPESQGANNGPTSLQLLPDTTAPDYEKISQLIASSEQDLTSTIIVPATIDLDYLEAKLNDDLPQRLADINERRQCVKNKLLSISCEISGFVDRRGKLDVSGSDNTLLFALPVHASVTAKAGVRETAVADATFFANASIEIGEDWQPRATVNTDFKWDRRPEIKLFNLVKITFGSKVEPALRKRLKAFEEKIPRLLSRVDFKSDVQQAWDKIQQPIEVSDHPPIYAEFNPEFIGYTGFVITESQLKTNLVIKGRTSITGSNSDSNNNSPLLPLARTDKGTGTFRLIVPAIVESGQIQAFLDKEIAEPIEIPVDSQGIEGRLTVNDMAIHLSETRKITLTASVEFDNRKSWLRTLDYFSWFSFSGNVVFDVSPLLDSEENVLTASELRLSTTTSSAVADKLAATLNLPLVKRRLLSLIQYDFSADIEQGIRAANDALTVSDGKRRDGKFAVSGQLKTVSVNRLIIVDGALAIVAIAEGRLEANLGKD